MSETSLDWYHCGRCGRLFQSPPGDPDERVCAHCGRDPSIEIVEQVTIPHLRARLPDGRESRGRSHAEGARRGGKKGTGVLFKFMIAWSVILLGTLVAFFLLREPGSSGTAGADSRLSDELKRMGVDEESAAVEKALQECAGVLSGFLSAATPEERSQYVADPVDMAGRMARFYSSHTVPPIASGTLRNAGAAMFRVGDEAMLDTRWKGGDDLLLDCVFVKRDDEWRIDWNDFARYQDHNWTRFLIGEGADEGQFRLLVRQRSGRGDTGSDKMVLVFSAPRFGHPAESTQPTIELTIPAGSESARMLAAGFRQHKEGVVPFGSKLALPEDDGMLRVRVRIRRLAERDAEGNRQFELAGVEACHWLSVNEPGVTPAEAEPAKRP